MQVKVAVCKGKLKRAKFRDLGNKKTSLPPEKIIELTNLSLSLKKKKTANTHQKEKSNFISLHWKNGNQSRNSWKKTQSTKWLNKANLCKVTKLKHSNWNENILYMKICLSLPPKSDKVEENSYSTPNSITYLQTSSENVKRKF